MDARPEQTDEQLLARVATDREAFAAFYDRHPDTYADLESRIDAEAASRRLYDAMQALSRGGRRGLELVALDQLTVTEAAAALGIRPGTARVRLARARRRLRGLLGQGEEGSPGRHPPDAAIAPAHHLPDPLEEPR